MYNNLFKLNKLNKGNSPRTPAQIGNYLKMIDIKRKMHGKQPFDRRDLLKHFNVPRKQRRAWWRSVCKEYQ